MAGGESLELNPEGLAEEETLSEVRDLLEQIEENTDELESHVTQVALDPTTRDAGTTATIIVEENLSRIKAAVRNTSSGRMFIGWTPALTTSNAPYFLDQDDVYVETESTGDIYAIVVSGTSTAAIEQLLEIPSPSPSSPGIGSRPIGSFPVGS